MDVNKVTLSSLSASLVLSAMKLYAGLVTGSLSVLAEFLHSALDSLTTLITFLTVRFSMKPPDATHPYGHRKVDSIGGLVGALLLVLTMIWVIDEALRRIVSPPEIIVGILPIGVMIFSIIIDFERSRALKRAAELTGSRALESDALHFSSDMLTSLAVISGLLFVSMGVRVLDPLMAILISALFLRSALKISKEAIYDLTDRIDPKVIEEVRKACLLMPEVLEVERVRARSVGSFLFADAKVKVKWGSAENLRERVAEVLREKLGMDVDLVIERVEGESLEERIARLSKEVEGVLDVHNLSISDLDGGKRVSLHAVVKPDTEVWRAHQISDELERRIKEIPGVTEAVAHVDPADIPALRFSREEMKELLMERVESMLKGTENKLESLDVAGPPWSITLRVLVPRNAELGVVHEFTHKLELAIREVVPSANVTVHFSTD
ncbi:MAG: cation-efflux pump [Candidatus Korarchaeum sp.]|nr:cation-efflux pump [Candidatus Korarchaeum sp.]MDW8035199.1 cation-efflux pump [Candidatus Korarchaeum sp.]